MSRQYISAVSSFLGVCVAFGVSVMPALAGTGGDRPIAIAFERVALPSPREAEQSFEANVSEPEQMASIQGAISRFKERAAKEGMSQSEVGGTLKEVGRLIEAKEAVVPAAERCLIAQQILSQAADPATVNQGHHNTCAVAALESRIYALTPSVVARLVADVALTGEFMTSRGQSIKLDPRNITPDKDAANRCIAMGVRSYASQLFQLSAINAYWQGQKKDPRGMSVPTGSMAYVQSEDRRDDAAGDTGERLMISYRDGVSEMVTGAAGEVICHPALSSGNIKQLTFALADRDAAVMLTANPVAGANKGEFITLNGPGLIFWNTSEDKQSEGWQTMAVGSDGPCAGGVCKFSERVAQSQK